MAGSPSVGTIQVRAPKLNDYMPVTECQSNILSVHLSLSLSLSHVRPGRRDDHETIYALCRDHLEHLAIQYINHNIIFVKI